LIQGLFKIYPYQEIPAAWPWPYHLAVLPADMENPPLWTRQVYIPVTHSVPPYCVREYSDRALKHNVDLKVWTPMQYLEMGAPPGTGWNDDCFSKNYFMTITHDEDLMLFGNPNVNPYSSLGELAFQYLVSTLIKEAEQRHAYWLEKNIRHLKQCISDDESRERDTQYFTENLHEDILRPIRHTKDLIWLVQFKK
jgi:hypothetical protein